MVSSLRTIVIKKEKKKSQDKDLSVVVSEANTVIKGSVDKLARVTNVIRGLSVAEAMNFLYFCPYISKESVAKLLKSATANALNEGLISQTDLKKLYISEIYTNQAWVLKRMRAASKGKGSPRKKAYSKMSIKLSIKTEA